MGDSVDGDGLDADKDSSITPCTPCGATQESVCCSARARLSPRGGGMACLFVRQTTRGGLCGHLPWPYATRAHSRRGLQLVLRPRRRLTPRSPLTVCAAAAASDSVEPEPASDPMELGADADALEPEPEDEPAPQGEPLAVPPFLTKLFDILSNDHLRQYIRWSIAGKSVHVVDAAGFQTKVLPNYWRHNNLPSFIRQLNVYGFQRTCEDVAHGRLEFYHESFVKVRARARTRNRREARRARPPPVAVQGEGETASLVCAHSYESSSDSRTARDLDRQGRRELLPQIQRGRQTRKRVLDSSEGESSRAGSSAHVGIAQLVRPRPRSSHTQCPHRRYP